MATTNKIQKPILQPIKWKGGPLYYQMTSSIERNHNSNTINSQFFGANPITKWYRREIAANIKDKCNQRTSLKIAELDIPGGSIVYSIAKTDLNSKEGIISTIYPNLPNNQGLLGTACSTCNNSTINCLTTSTDTTNVCFSQQNDARKRCRSGGMIRTKYKAGNNNDTEYFTNNKQYLTSRNRSIKQNEYAYIRQGTGSISTTTINASVAAKNNIYSPAGLSHCPKYKISVVAGNNTFSYIWLDGTEYSVVIPDGYYDINDLNMAFQNIMLANKTYYTNNQNHSQIFLLLLTYNSGLGVIEIDVSPSLTSDTNYSIPVGGWSSDTQTIPQLVLPSSTLTTQALGFTAGNYPATNSAVIMQSFTGITTGQLAPAYVALYYKPSNSQYATQGGVSSSSRITRLKYQTIQTSALRTGNVYGSAVANALSYSVPTPDYPTTVKDKAGYLMTATPIISVYDGGRGINRCRPFIYRRR